MANELARHHIRVNSVHPAGVNTPMVPRLDDLPGLIDQPTPSLGAMFGERPARSTWWTPRDISNAVLFLVSDEARYVTGLEFTVDAGSTIH